MKFKEKPVLNKFTENSDGTICAEYFCSCEDDALLLYALAQNTGGLIEDLSSYSIVNIAENSNPINVDVKVASDEFLEILKPK